MTSKDFRKIRMPSSQQMRAAMQKHLPAFRVREAPEPIQQPNETPAATPATTSTVQPARPVVAARPAARPTTGSTLPPKIGLGAARAEAASHAEAEHKAALKAIADAREAALLRAKAVHSAQPEQPVQIAEPEQAEVGEQVAEPQRVARATPAAESVVPDVEPITTIEQIDIETHETAEQREALPETLQDGDFTAQGVPTTEVVADHAEPADSDAEPDVRPEVTDTDDVLQPAEPLQTTDDETTVQVWEHTDPVDADQTPELDAPKPRSAALPTAFPTIQPVGATDAADRAPHIAPTVTVGDALASQAAQAWRGTPSKDKHYGRNLWLFVWVVLLLGAAQTSLFVAPLIGLYVNAAVFANLVYMALRQERIRQLLIAVAIIPLAMLFSLSLPEMSPFLRTTNVMVVILVLGLVYQYLFTLDYPTEGTRLKLTRHGYLFAIPLMLVLGQFLGLLGFGLLHNQYDFQGNMIALVALSAVVFAVAEEILFRGLIQQKAMGVFHPITAAIFSAALYTLVSFGHHGGIFTPVFAAILGGTLALIYSRKQNLVLTIAINAGAKLTYIGLVAIFVLRG